MELLFSVLIIITGLCILGLLLIFLGGRETYRVYRYRVFGFNEDTIVSMIILIMGIVCILMGVSAFF